MDAHRRCRPFYTSSGAHQRLDARRYCTKFYQYPVPSSQFPVPSPQSPVFSSIKFLTHAPNVNDHRAATKIPWCPLRHRGPALFRSAANVNDPEPRPLVAVRTVHRTSKTLPGDHFSRYGTIIQPSLAYCHCCYLADRENQLQRHLCRHRAPPQTHFRQRYPTLSGVL